MKAADLLLEQKLLSTDQHEAIKRIANAMGERSEEVIVTNSVMSEAELLKHLSTLYRTKFASSDKLSRAEIPRATLEMIPRRVAETFNVFPVMFDAQASVLSVVAADPDDANLVRELQLVSGAREVRAFFARPAAITAAILKHHGKDARAFDRFERERLANQVANQGTGNTISLDRRLSGNGTGTGTGTGTGAAQPAPKPEPPKRAPEPQRTLSVPRMNAVATRNHALDAPPLPGAPGAGRAPAASAGTNAAPRAAMPTAVPSAGNAAMALDAPFGNAAFAPAPLTAMPPAPQVPAEAQFTFDGTLDLLNVLVSLLENSRAELRGHSAHVARLARRLCERLNLPKEETQSIVMAAHLHDLAKMGQFHLTALNVADYDGHRVAAEKVVETPVRLLEAVNIPKATRDAITQMYERWNGDGFPNGLSGKEISLGARVLALADVYADLTQNPRNPYRKQLEASDACAVLVKHKERVFDPHLVDLFKTVIMGEDMKARLLATRRRALIVDPDPEESTVLELRMIEQGFEVQTARTMESAKTLLGKGDVELVVSELSLPDGNGLALLAEARASSWGKDMPWVIHTAIQNRAEAQRAFELGVLDFVSKPAPTDVLVAKLRALTGNTKKLVSRGVSGSLREMSIPDIVQVLFHGRKSGKLVLRAGSEEGEVHFIDGAVADAAFAGAKGAEAFYLLLKLTDGDFALDPSFVPPAKVIQESSEGLLLEGLRRMDEGI